MGDLPITALVALMDDYKAGLIPLHTIDKAGERTQRYAAAMAELDAILAALTAAEKARGDGVDIAEVIARAERAEAERDEAKKRNADIALQLRDEKLKPKLAPSAQLARAATAETALRELRARVAEAEAVKLRDLMKILSLLTEG